MDEAAGNPYWPFLEGSYVDLLENVAQEAIGHGALRDVYREPEAFVRAGFQVLISIPMAVLQGICGASLRARKGRDEDMYAWLTNNLRKASGRPSIYMIEFTDQVGGALRYKDMRRVVGYIRRYASPQSSADVDLAVEVDQASAAYPLTEDDEEAIRAQGHRAWISNAQARTALLELLDKLDEQITAAIGVDPDDTRRMPFVMRDVGYTHRGIKRLDEQDLTPSANMIMAVFGAVAKAKELPYKLYGEFIFLGFRREHAALAEVLFSILAQSYTWTGRGFNSVLAGGSIASNSQYEEGDWNLWQADVLRESPIEENARIERERAQDLEEEVGENERRILVQQVNVLSRIAKNVDTAVYNRT